MTTLHERIETPLPLQDTFYFIANSQWPLVDENGKLAADDKLQDPVVLKINLEKRHR